MTFTPLASSSHGNAYLLDDGTTRLLIECGPTYKHLQKLTGYTAAQLHGCLISHEHKDHAGCYKQLLKNGVPVYASKGTAESLECDIMEELEPWEMERIGTFDVLPFPVFHDAKEPMGFLIRSQCDGEKLVFATDTVNLAYQFPGVNLVAIECNYADDILDRVQKMPEKVRYRIRNAHMSIIRCCTWLEKLDKSNVREIYLMHLSDACSNEWMFRRMVQDVVGPYIHVTICPKEREGL